MLGTGRVLYSKPKSSKQGKRCKWLNGVSKRFIWLQWPAFESHVLCANMFFAHARVCLKMWHTPQNCQFEWENDDKPIETMGFWCFSLEFSDKSDVDSPRCPASDSTRPPNSFNRDHDPAGAALLGKSLFQVCKPSVGLYIYIYTYICVYCVYVCVHTVRGLSRYPYHHIYIYIYTQYTYIYICAVYVQVV